MSWISHWDTSFDLSRGGVELSFRKNEDMVNLLVETKEIKKINKTISNIGKSSISSRYHIVGTRGIGKSTILNHITYSLFKNINDNNILPVHSTMIGTAKDEKELEFIFFKNLLESIFDLPDDFKLFNVDKKYGTLNSKIMEAEIEYKTIIKRIGSISFEFVYNAFENQLSHLKIYFNKVIFLIDGLDKQDTEIVLKFLRSTQERFNTIITKYNCILIDSADPSWRDTLGTKEFSGVRGVPINLRGWTVNEVEALINQRLSNIGIFINPFDIKAIEILVKDFQGNCREILQYSTSLLHYAATQNIKTIGPGIAREIIWNDNAKDKFFNKIITDNEMRYAFEKLEYIYNDRQMMNILIAIFSQKNKYLSILLPYKDRSSIGITLTDKQYAQKIGILINKGCMRRSKIKDHIELENDIYGLIEYADNLQQSIIALPAILSTLESEIKKTYPSPKGKIRISDEIENIFQRNSDKWLTYEQIIEILYSNPKTIDNIKKQYKDNYDITLKQIIPLNIGKLYSDGKIMKDIENNCYRWRPNIIEYELSELYKSKDILDIIETIEESLVNNNFSTFIINCKTLLNIMIKKIASLSNIISNINYINNIPAIKDLFYILDIDIKTPIPLDIIINNLDIQPINKDEAKVVLSNLYLYIHRIYNKYIQFEKYNNVNYNNSKIIEKYKVGNTKINERKYFNEYILNHLINNYGQIIDIMTDIKIKNGYTNQNNSLIKMLYNINILQKSKLYECSICKNKIIISSNNENNNFCQEHKIPLTQISDEIYCLTNEAYQSWTVWMEEYTKKIITSLFIYNYQSGCTFKPINKNKSSTIEELDGILLYNGKIIAIECKEIFENNSDTIINEITSKLDNLGYINSCIFIYKEIKNKLIFDASIRKYQAQIFPIQIAEPKKFREKLLYILKQIN